MGLFEAAQGLGVGGWEGPPSLKFVTHIRIFSPKIIKFCYIKKNRYRFHFDTYLLIILTFIESLKIVLISMVTILVMPVEIATLGLLKIKIFWNKDYDVIISFLDVTNKVLTRDSNYFVNLVMWPKFGNSSISMTEVTTISIL